MVAASLLSSGSLLLALAISIAAKPVLEQNSPMRLPLMKRRSLSKYSVVELDRRRLNSLSHGSRRVDGSDFDATTSSTSRTSNSGNVSASYQINHYYVHIGVGDSNKTCK